MPSYYPENNQSLPTDNAERALHKINDILNSGGGSVSSGNPVSQAGKSSATALAANPNRKKAFIQNNGTNVLFVKEGDGCSTTDYSATLNACSSTADGRGGSYNVLTTAKITTAGTSPNYAVTEVS